VTLFLMHTPVEELFSTLFRDNTIDQTTMNFLCGMVSDVLYCVDAILTRRRTACPEFSHKLSVNNSENGFVLSILTHLPFFERKTYVWFFPLPSIEAYFAMPRIDGTWSTFDLSESERIHIFEAHSRSVDLDGFEICSGEDAEGSSLVEFYKIGPAWRVNVDPIFGAQSSRGSRGRSRSKVSGKKKDLEKERSTSLKKRAVEASPRKVDVFDDRALCEGMNNIDLSPRTPTDCRTPRKSEYEIKVPPLLCCKVAGDKTPLQSVQKILEKFDEEIFDPQVSLSSLFNLNVHHDISDEFGDSLDRLHDVFVNMSNRIPTSNDIDEKMTEIKTSVKSLFIKLLALGIPLVAVSYSVYRLIYALRHPRECGMKSIFFWSFVSNFLIGFFLSLVVDGPMVLLKASGVGLMAFITKIQNRNREQHEDPLDDSIMSPQFNDGVEDKLFNNLSTLVLSFFSIQAVGTAPSGKKIDKFMSLVGQLPRATTGVSFIMDNVIEMVQMAINFVRTNVLGLESFTWFEDTFPEVDRWCRKVQKIADESRESSWLINSINSQRVFELYKEGNAMFLNKYSSLESTRVRNAVQAYMTVLKKLMVPFEQANISGIAARMEPVTLFLGGAPGVGKSLITIPLLTEVILEVLPEERRPELLANYMDFIYNRQTEHQYWDRYYGQIACVFDDFLQKRDVAGLPDSETMDIIRVTNMFPNVLHMAALENKGNTVFTSRIVVCTSNTFSMKVESIVEPEALCRRFTHTYRAVPKKEFCTPETRNRGSCDRRLDRNHPDIKGNALNHDAIEFEEMKWGNRHEAFPTGRVVDFKRLVQIMVDDYRDRSNRSDAYNHKVKESLEKKYADMTAHSEYFEPQVLGDEDESIDMVPLQNLCSSFDSKGPLERDSVDLSNLVLDDIQLFNEKLVDEESKVDSIKELLSLGVEPRRCSDLAFAICPQGVIRFGSSRTLWAFAHTVPKFWAQIISVIKDAHMGDISKAICRVQNMIDMLMLKGSNRCAIEKEMFRRLQDDVTWYYIGDEEMSCLEKARITLSEFYDHMKTSISSFVKEHPYLTIFGTITTILGLWKTFTMLRSIFSGGDDFLSPESGHARKGKVKDHKQRPSKVPAEMIFSPQDGSSHKDMTSDAETEWVKQGGGDLNAIQLAKRLIQKQSYGVSVPWKEQRIGAVLFLRGRVCIFPRHYISWFNNEVKLGRCTLDTEITLRNDWLTSGYKLTVREFIDVKECPHLAQQDIAILVAPNRVHQHGDITNLFVTVESLDKPFDKTVHLIVLEDDKGWRIDSGIAQTVHHHAVGTAEHHWRVDVGYKYPFPTMSGDCGSVLLLNNKAIAPGKILGLHVAGNGKNLGLAAALTKDVIDSALKLVEVQDKIAAPSEVMLEPQLSSKPFEANMVPLCKAKRPISLAGKTKILRSPLYGAWGLAKTKPAYLRPQLIGNDIVDPRRVGLSGYCAGNHRVDPEIVRAVSDNVASHLISIACETSRRKPIVFSFDQAVCGIVGVDYCDPIDRSTSPGYPWVLDKPPGFPGKSWWFGKDGDVDVSNPRATIVRVKVDEIISAAKEGRRLFHPYVDFPKDERRPIAKADAMKTRSISGCSLDYSIAVRMYFLDFSMFLMANRMSTKSCVGINPRSGEWDVLARLISRFPKVVAGDFSGFDKTQIAEFLWAVLYVINKWYDSSSVDDLVRTVLWSDVVNSIHLFDGDFVQWIKSLPSGHPLTVIINSIIHEMYIQYCYVLLHPQHLHGLQFFHDFVEIQTYGDDGVYSISDVIIPWFNQITISDTMATFGLVYTDENKSVDIVPYRKLSEVTFLKRGFRFDDSLGRYVAPLSLDTILEMPYWTKDGPGPLEITKENVKTALMELSLHGESLFSQYSSVIIAACRDRMNWFPPASSFVVNFETAMNTREEW
jgi:hypothetical protein